MKGKADKLDLVQLRPREKGVVVAINGGDGLVRRLDTLGVRIGAEITKISAQLMRGPVIVRIGSTQVALGFGMARKVMVSRQSIDDGQQTKLRR
jgi:ferrous iron transport protein A